MLALHSMSFAQGVSTVGSAKITDTNKVKAYITIFDNNIKATNYASADSNKVLGVDASGNVTLRTKGTASGYIPYPDTLRSGHIATYYYVDSLGNTYIKWGDTVSTIATKTNVAAKLNIADTSGMLAPYLRAIDTASLSNRIDNIPTGGSISDTLGTIFSDNFYRPILGTDYTYTLPVATVTFPDSTYMLFTKSSSTTTFGDYIERVEYSANSKSTLHATIVPQDKTSTSNGVAIGYKGGANEGRDLIAQFSCASSGATAGKITLYYNTASGIGATTFGQSSALPFSVGDTLDCFVIRNDTALTCYYINSTTGDSITLDYAYSLTSTSNQQMPATSNVRMYALGGTQKVIKFELSSQQYTNNDLFIVNSIGTGYSTTKLADRFTNVLYPNDRNAYTILGGAGDDAADVLNLLPEIRKHKPKNVYLFIGTNDAISATNTTTFAARVDSIMKALLYTGANVYVGSAFPTTSDATAYNTKLSASAVTYGKQYIDVFSYLKTVGSTTLKTIYSADGIHPNSLGNVKIAQVIAGASKDVPYNTSDNWLATSYIKNGGNYQNSFLLYGTRTNKEVYFITNNTVRQTTAASGEIGMPNITTNTPLSVQGTVVNVPVVSATNSSNGGWSGYSINTTGTSVGQYRILVNGVVKTIIGTPNGSTDFGIANISYSGNNFGFQLPSDGSLLFMDANNGVNAFKVTAGGIGYLKTSLAIGATTANASAILDVTSTTKGVLLPRMTGLQAEAISSPADGLIIYSTDGSGSTITSAGFWGYTGGWVKLN